MKLCIDSRFSETLAGDSEHWGCCGLVFADKRLVSQHVTKAHDDEVSAKVSELEREQLCADRQAGSLLDQGACGSFPESWPMPLYDPAEHAEGNAIRR